MIGSGLRHGELDRHLGGRDRRGGIAADRHAEAFDAGRASKTILLNIPETEDLYVIVDLKGNVFYQDNAMERGWRYEEDALHEARALESRGEGRFSVVRQSQLPA